MKESDQDFERIFQGAISEIDLTGFGSDQRPRHAQIALAVFRRRKAARDRKRQRRRDWKR